MFLSYSSVRMLPSGREQSVPTVGGVPFLAPRKKGLPSTTVQRDSGTVGETVEAGRSALDGRLGWAFFRPVGCWGPTVGGSGLECAGPTSQHALEGRTGAGGGWDSSLQEVEIGRASCRERV